MCDSDVFHSSHAASGTRLAKTEPKWPTLPVDDSQIIMYHSCTGFASDHIVAGITRMCTLSATPKDIVRGRNIF